jgi:transcriptional regulator with XRE-family HTH domain
MDGYQMIADTKLFGGRVKLTREERGLTASDLARLTDVTPTAVWNWENRNRTPQSKTLTSLAQVLGVSKEWLLTGGAESQAAVEDRVSTQPTDLSTHPLEDLINAIAKKGFSVSVAPKL